MALADEVHGVAVAEVTAATPHAQLLTVGAERQRRGARLAARTGAHARHSHGQQQQPHARHRHQLTDTSTRLSHAQHCPSVCSVRRVKTQFHCRVAVMLDK